jgi:2-oxo-3-hexenedioate decarboxylase
MDEASVNEQISREVLALLGTEQQVEPFSRRYPGFDLAEAYKIVARVRDLRSARGDTAVGRKIGFTNRSIWGDLGIAAPIWNYVFDTTVSSAPSGAARTGLRGMPEPRIEPEIVLHLASAPLPGMTTDELFDCIDWVAPGFEIVFSIFPGWKFSAADAAAAYGVHGALFIGDKLHLSGARVEHAAQIRAFDVELKSDAGRRRTGHATNVLGGPIEALQFLVDEIARYPVCEPLHAGDIVTTGTLTEAMPLRPGETWRAQFRGIPLDPLQLTIT